MIRLFVDQKKIVTSQVITVMGDDFNYLIKVMRLKENDQFLIFNGLDGEFLVQIIQVGKKNCQIQLIKQTKEQENSPKISLAFAPIKNVRQDFVAQKACELGVWRIYPLLMQHSIVDKINAKKKNQHAIDFTSQNSLSKHNC